MRNYQRTRNNPYLLPHHLYMRTLYIIRDYERLKQKAEEHEKEELKDIDLSKVMITHSFADESAKYLFEQLKQYVPEENIMITNAGCVISSHCGKGTIGILYALK